MTNTCCSHCRYARASDQREFCKDSTCLCHIPTAQSVRHQPPEVKDDWEKELLEILEAFNKEHKYCAAHGEGLYCHLDNEEGNEENVVPLIVSFIRTLLKPLEEQKDSKE